MEPAQILDGGSVARGSKVHRIMKTCRSFLGGLFRAREPSVATSRRLIRTVLERAKEEAAPEDDVLADSYAAGPEQARIHQLRWSPVASPRDRK